MPALVLCVCRHRWARDQIGDRQRQSGTQFPHAPRLACRMQTQGP
ncbi:hypothetical protein PY32053_02209 [Paracoccus yeei]|uniref:Uncharacterized protein n=1 Tax=Paracoccus yeei TaxID=147645 RepID=A0A386UPT5_9RHOB|nr:hypothetical protein PY32053_02209 [Paracoccus yeei]